MATIAWCIALALLAGASGSGQKLRGESLAAQVQQVLQARTEAAGSSARVQATGRVPDLSLPQGAVRIDVGDVPGRWPRAHAIVPVKVVVEGHAPRTVPVGISASDVRTVMSYAADFGAGTDAARLRTRQARVDMTCCDGEVAMDVHALQSRRLRRAVRAGQPVLLSDLEARPLVAAQQKVAVAVERGPVRIVTTGIALADGAVGDRIPVRTAESRQVVRARIVEQGKVAVDE